MATRNKIIETVTEALRGDFQNVTNRFVTISDYVDEPGDVNKWPLLNVGMGSHSVDLSLDGSIETELALPVVIVGYVIAEDSNDLQLAVADLGDNVTASLTKAANIDKFCKANFGIVNIDFFPAEDERHYEVGVMMMVANVVSGD